MWQVRVHSRKRDHTRPNVKNTATGATLRNAARFVALGRGGCLARGGDTYLPYSLAYVNTGSARDSGLCSVFCSRRWWVQKSLPATPRHTLPPVAVMSLPPLLPARPPLARKIGDR